MTIFDFGNGVPECFTTDGGSLSVTNLMVKQGTGSLRWDFSKGDKLIVNADIGYRKLVPDGRDFRVYVFGMYLFGFGAEGSLHVAFCKDGIEQTGFDAELGFKNWRSVTACYDRDMTGDACEGMNSMVITANATGSLLFSEIVTEGRVDHRHILRSYQAPFINNDEIVLKKDWQVARKYAHIKTDEKTVECIKKRALNYIASEFSKEIPDTFEKLLEKTKDFDIHKNELGITGKRVEWYNQRRIVEDSPLRDEPFISLRVVTNLMQNIAVYYLKTKDKRAADLYMDILEYVMVQGLVEGSSFGTHKILDYGVRPFYTSAMAMHDVIESRGLTDEVTSSMLWFLHAWQKGFTDGVAMRKASSDDLFNSARGLLFAILMLKDNQKQCQLLAAFSNWVSASLEYRPGLMGMFKEDGCVFHHHGHYIGYAKGGLTGLTPIAYMLSGTQFELSDEAYSNLKNVIYSFNFQCSGDYVPIALSGRHPTGKELLDPAIFKYFALCALEKGDVVSAGLYLDVKKEPEDENDLKIFEKAEKGANKSGNRTFPYACCTVHRRPGFMAVAKGYSKYLWGSEIYKGDNLYGRYRSYGVLEIINGESPFKHDGYNWNRFPGATTVNLPIEDLKADVRNVDDKSGFEEMLLSDQSFAGSLSLGDNGMFSMILSEHPKYNGSHKARKSIFFHDDFVVLLGSGISNDCAEKTETTLFQISLDTYPQKPYLNGKEQDGSYVVKVGDVLRDNCGNNYYIKPGTHISLSNGMQKSYHSEDCSETSGEFSCGVINHGSKPQNQGYEYAIGINGAANTGYTVLRQDDSVHAVKIGNITYMAIFDPENCDLVKTNTPLLLMIDETSEQIRYSICNPDLALYGEDPSQFDENGNQIEVSIYSRQWLCNPIGIHNVSLYVPEKGISFEGELRGGFSYEYRLRKESEKQ